MSTSTNPIFFLLVDDHEDNLQLLKSILSREEVVILTARSGAEALELVSEKEVGLAFLDVRMPGMDGFELAERIRLTEAGRTVPIIFLTGDTDQQRRFRGYETGAVDIIYKPFEPDILRSKANVFFELYRQRQLLSQQHDELIVHAESLAKAKADAERASAAKGEFLAMMSHEIRTPLHGVVGFTSLLQATILSSEQREITDCIEFSSTQLLALVSDVLDLARVESGNLTLENRLIDLNSLFKKIASPSKLEAESKGLTFRAIYDPSLPSLVVTDSLRLSQILGNLLRNAIKFTAQGSIEIEAKATAVSPGSCEVTFSIKDTGIGIPPTQQERLFQPFAQAEPSLSRRFGGTGLGLVIVHRLCTLMGGTVSMESTEGVGTTFTATILMKTEEGSYSPSSSDAQTIGSVNLPAPLRVLVAEDNIVSQKLMTRILHKIGCEVTTVSNGSECIETFRSQCFDVILMDVNMPEMDGLQASRVIRSISTKKPPVPIVALTAGVTPEQRQKCHEAGMDFFLGKPFTNDGLNRVLREAFPGEESTV